MARKSAEPVRCALCGTKEVSEPRGDERYCRDCWDKKIAVEDIVAREFTLKRYIRAHSAEKYLVYHSTQKRPIGQVQVLDDGYDLFLTVLLYPTFAWDDEAYHLENDPEHRTFAEILVDVIAADVIEPWGGGKWHLEVFRSTAPIPRTGTGRCSAPLPVPRPVPRSAFTCELAMSLDISAIQQALSDDGLDGWLLYDFHGSNPIATKLAGLTGRHTTRRWYYFIPASGTPVKLVHAIEPSMLDAMPGERRVYAGRLELESGIRGLAVAKLAASRWSTRPTARSRTSRAWTPARWTSSAAWACAWSRRATSSDGSRRPGMPAPSPRTARPPRSSTGSRTGPSTTSGRRLDAGEPVHEFEVQQAMMGWLTEEGLVTDAPPIVAAQENAGNPHYAPDADRFASDSVQ